MNTKIFLLAASLLGLTGPALADEPDGIKLPQGFHATVVADHLGVLRHLAFRDNDDLYVSTQWNNTGTSGDLIAIHLDKDRRADKTVHFGVMAGGTGVRVYKGALYAASLARVYRYSFKGKDLVPVSEPAIVLDGMAATRSTSRGLTFDDKGNMFVSSGVIAGVDWCADPSVPKGQPIKGLNPCPLLNGRGGIVRFSATKLNQQFKDGELWGNGIRDMAALTWSPADNALYALVHGRDQTSKSFPNAVTDVQDDAISDEMVKVTKGTNLGWPYSYWDGAQKKRILAPEYTGNGTTEAPAGQYAVPVAEFHPRSSPLDLMFHDGKNVPVKYKNGAFIARHGAASLSKPANGNNGFDVAFIPFDKNGVAGPLEEFAAGFAGPNIADKLAAKAKFRPVGVTEAPDGSLYVTDSQSGRIWRIAYSGN
jgi:glucose/arabinose dehydrogenase